MKLTEADIEKAAAILMGTTSPELPLWADADETRKTAYRQIVTDLAGALDTERTDAAVAVFMEWMGNEKALGGLDSSNPTRRE